MKRITQLVLVWISLQTIGCTPIGKLYYGIKRPDFETDSSVRQFAAKLGLPDAPVYTVKFDAWKNNSRLQSPDVYVFNKYGKYIPYKDPAKPNCTGPAELFLSYLDTTALYNYSDEYSLQSVVDQLNTTSCESPGLRNFDNKDFVIFATFTKWQGKKFQRGKTMVWLDSLQNNKHISYELILVNVDFQNCWNADQKKMLEKR